MIGSVCSPRMFVPAYEIDPDIRQDTLFVTQPRRVDLPAPFEPRSETISPFSTDIVTPASAVTGP